MNLLNSLDCIAVLGNTGVGACNFNPKNIVAAILTPKGYQIPLAAAASSAALLTQLQADAQAPTKAARIYPISNFVAAADASTGLQKQTFSYGVEAPVRDGINNWTFQFVSGGLSLLSKLRLYNKTTSYDFLFVDADNNIIGTKGKDSTGNKVLQAIPNMYFWAHQWKVNDGSKVTDYQIEFAFLPNYVNENVGYITAGFDFTSNILGLQDLVVSGAGNATPGTYDLQVVTDATGFNLGDLYPTALASAGLWVASNTATGTSITITSVTYSAVTKKFSLVLTTTAPPYPASGTITFNLAAPSVLAAAGISGFESLGSVAITKN